MAIVFCVRHKNMWSYLINTIFFFSINFPASIR